MLENQYTYEVKDEVEKELKNDDLREIDANIERLRKENELLKFDIRYLGAKHKQIAKKQTEYIRENPYLMSNGSWGNRILDMSRDEDYALTMVEDRMSMSFSDLNNISIIKHDHNSKSLGEDEFIREIDEIKEEDCEGTYLNYNFLYRWMLKR
jgi:hypothetical protein